MQKEKKNDNVIGIGHNNNQYSKEQFERLLKSYHHSMRFARQEINKVARFLDEAFTKYPGSDSHHRKLKDFEIHESRNYGLKSKDELINFCNQKMDKLDNIAKAEGVEIIKERTHFNLPGGSDIEIRDAVKKEPNDKN